jgi:hypothetical protein
MPGLEAGMKSQTRRYLRWTENRVARSRGYVSVQRLVAATTEYIDTSPVEEQPGQSTPNPTSRVMEQSR